ncbi:ABC transporter ATP-binding protein [Nitratireductor mangrovi]|uniref:Spermidine/putrescine import ATP-binding protein PotA n=1 Tax=Nitratireductor mangrovi TaxID=2599600 RepID=A0A5B8KUD3_9HYPH|nr:ABC transporter ATP-binding protein [Nitratireductor mangrovi]QDY99157.1 ABC transporter ATP-binding protein [Nitratireductor mangrovi]
MSTIELRHVRKSFAGNIVAVENVDLFVDEGEFVVLLGPSGCGKTTTLRMIAGFEKPSSGQILFGGRDVTHTPTRQREVGMVFQNYALFPNMTVAENIAFGLKQRKISSKAIADRVNEMLSLAQLADRRDQYPAELSGGQQQRVALVRALAISPRLLLMDEPLGALDLKLREMLQIELKQLQRKLGITTVLVTHDQQEAMSLADRIVVMQEGRMRQLGSPEELYNKPNSRFVAEFVGKNNVLSGIVKNAGKDELSIQIGEGDSACDVVAVQAKTDSWKAGDQIALGLRPEHLYVAPPGEEVQSSNCLPGKVSERRFLGNFVHYHVELPWKQMVIIECPTRLSQYEPGSDIVVHFKRQDCQPLAASSVVDA